MFTGEVGSEKCFQKISIIILTHVLTQNLNKFQENFELE
jgi:hypothetical protein